WTRCGNSFLQVTQVSIQKSTTMTLPLSCLIWSASSGYLTTLTSTLPASAAKAVTAARARAPSPREVRMGFLPNKNRPRWGRILIHRNGIGRAGLAGFAPAADAVERPPGAPAAGRAGPHHLGGVDKAFTVQGLPHVIGRQPVRVRQQADSARGQHLFHQVH